MKNVTINNYEIHPSNGLEKTIDLMHYLETLSINNPKFVKFVFETFSSNCAACIPGKIWNYMIENFKYVTDDPYDEKLTAPYVLLETKEGDCDDFALFSKTCLDILGGWFTNYLLLAKKRNEFTHIVTFAHRGIFGNKYNDPIVIDGANSNFNIINPVYRFYKIV